MLRLLFPGAAAPARGGPTMAIQALEAQRALLPYALIFFGVSLPIYVWAGSFAEDATWMAATFAVFAINWGAFYAVTGWLRRPQAQDPALRARVQILGALLWAGAVAQIAAFADGAGVVREPLLMLSTAAAVAVTFFTAPNLTGLLIVGPIACAGPLWALFSRPQTSDAGVLAFGAVALSMALCLVVNRTLRGQAAMAAEREALIAERAVSLERAQKVARSKSDIVATLSHEIRNGLNGVTHVLAAAAGQGGRAAPSREQLNAALTAANELVAVLNATLDSETAEQGRLMLDSQPFDPVRLTRDLVLLSRPHASAKGVELTLHVDAELENRTSGAVVADVTRVRQVLSNLIGNAVKYTVRGRIEARIERRGDGRIAIEIADTGPGLTPEELEQAFEPFRRIERTGAGVPGAGLGLSLSRHLTDLMGGRLDCRSAPGVGSCFTVDLPFDDGAFCEGIEVGPAISGDPAKRQLRVLVAEDDALNAAMLRAILEQLGHKVVHAQNGRRAVDLAKLADFDLMMLDGRMPGLDGPAAAAAIRALDGPVANTPIIAVIGGDADEARECLDAGVDAVLRKPVTVAGVARAVADAAARGRMDAEAARSVA
ncbi:signal transduction histidine kinase/AmiR/NasT family two-component response regulator [Caulobacter ginsengisoli]|uniref:histidine kinase n=2 Tax=Caulobacter ginsengisoli TaxID=400775 RepID=A0ABU0INV8_9CAUL|nr:signal transduction histidine kinase/AmiR/NasT family two-component response regulator [Caulobacter ginsengisoli]